MATKMSYDNLAHELGRVALSRDELRFELYDVKKERDTYRDLCGELYNALRLAKDMFVANDMQLPHTFEVIDSAIDKAEAIMGENSNG